MREVRQVLESIVDRFDPAADSFARLLRTHQERRQRHHRGLTVTLVALLVAAAAVIGLEASQADAAKGPTALHFSKKATTAVDYPACSAKTGSGAYTPTLSSSSGSSGSAIEVAGPLPVTDEAGDNIGQTATEVVVYWNLDSNDWGSALTSPLAPSGAVAGTSVQLLGTQDVASQCGYDVQIQVPSSPTGSYPIVVLYEGSDTSGVGASALPPASYEVTGG